MGTSLRAGRFTLADLDRTLAEGSGLAELMSAVAAVLRVTHRQRWLLALRNPEGLTAAEQSAVTRGIRQAVAGLAEQGRVPAPEAAAEAAAQWVTRFLQGRSEQWTRLGELTDRVAAAVSTRIDSGDFELFLNHEQRLLAAAEVARQLPGYLGPERLVASEPEIFALAEGLVQANLGAGVLEEFLRDQSLTEIMLGAGGQIWVEQSGRLQATGRTLPERRAVWFAQRLAAVIGGRIDASEPTLDGFLADGSRVHVVIPPVVMDGVAITIRRHTRRPTLPQLLASGAVTPEVVDFLRIAVRGRANVLISGGTSSGKTSLLGLFAGFIAPTERIITLEDSPELQLPLPHVIRLRTRRPNIEGRGEVTMRSLVRECLRMRPDRIIIGEVRGAEALDMIEALNTGHDGGLSTAHANSAADLLRRLSQMCKRGDPTLTDSGAYELIATGVHLIVHAQRRIIGERVIRGVEEVVEIIEYQPDRPGALGFKTNRIFCRGPGGLQQTGQISQGLSQHLRLGGVDPGPWSGSGKPADIS